MLGASGLASTIIGEWLIRMGTIGELFPLTWQSGVHVLTARGQARVR
jgi:hypothetical protein